MKDIIITIAVPTVAALSAYLIARRTSSGRIGSSDATDLWNESQAMRTELRNEVKELRVMVSDLKRKIDELEVEKLANKEKIIELQQKVNILEGKVKALEKKI